MILTDDRHIFAIWIHRVPGPGIDVTEHIKEVFEQRLRDKLNHTAGAWRISLTIKRCRYTRNLWMHSTRPLRCYKMKHHFLYNLFSNSFQGYKNKWLVFLMLQNRQFRAWLLFVPSLRSYTHLTFQHQSHISCYIVTHCFFYYNKRVNLKLLCLFHLYPVLV